MVISSLLTIIAAIGGVGRVEPTNSAISLQVIQKRKFANSIINSTRELISIQVKILCKSLGKVVTNKRRGNQVKLD